MLGATPTSAVAAQDAGQSSARPMEGPSASDPCLPSDVRSGGSADGTQACIREACRAAAADAGANAAEQAALRRLWDIYTHTVLPIERRCFFQHFAQPPITESEFEARPQVLLVGQYSTGKTSMIQWLTGVDSPHFDVKPQPSTDKFMAIVHGHEERLIQGNAAAVLPQLPYQGLATFGASFLGNFQALTQNSDILQGVSLIDTPGVLSGNKQRIGRDYDFAAVCAWMAERADLVLLTFDAHKLDISDEFEQVMEVLRPFRDKVRCVLNKADQIDATNLVRVYGALMWNCGKVLRTPEVARVYVSSFWDIPYRYTDHTQLFDEDKKAVLRELTTLPRTALLRKINMFVARVRRVKAHYAIMTHIQSRLPRRILSFSRNVQELDREWVIANFATLCTEVSQLRALSDGDMPKIDTFLARLASFENMSQLPTWKAAEVEKLDQIVRVEVPNLMAPVGGVTVAPMKCVNEEPDRRSWVGFLGRGGGNAKRQKT